MKGLGGVALLEEVCDWVVDFEISKAHAKLRVSSQVRISGGSSQLILQHYVCLHVAMLTNTDNGQNP